MNDFLAEAELQKFWIVAGFALGSAITGSRKSARKKANIEWRRHRDEVKRRKRAQRKAYK